MGQTTTKMEGNQQKMIQPVLNKEQKKFIEIFQENFETQKTFQPSDMQKIFPNRKVFCDKFFDWICFLSYRLTMNRESFLYGCEILLCKSEKVINHNYKEHQYTFFEVLLHLVVCQKPENVKVITESQIEEFVRLIFDIWFGGGSNPDLIKAVFKGLINKFEKQGHYEYNEFLQQVRNVFPTAEHFTKRQLRSLLLEKKDINMPQIEQEHLLTQQIFTLIGMTNNKLLNQTKAQLLFDIQHSGNSFYTLADALKGYSSPVIILIEVEYKKMEKTVNDVFGIYADCLWEDKIQYFGNSSTYLFSILCRFDIFFPTLHEQNFIYLNTQHVVNKTIKTGIGFGGNKTKSRIWLDQDLFQKSEIHDYEDKTFREGLISDCYTEYLKITNLEVWGFPNNKTEKIQQQYHSMQDVIHRASTNFQSNHDFQHEFESQDFRDVKQTIIDRDRKTTYF